MTQSLKSGDGAQKVLSALGSLLSLMGNGTQQPLQTQSLDVSSRESSLAFLCTSNFYFLIIEFKMAAHQKDVLGYYGS